MRISKLAKAIKSTGSCLVLDVCGDTWIGNGQALYCAPKLPRMTGREQVRAVLDIPEKAWEKINMKEAQYENPKDVVGMNLCDYCEGEQDTEKLRVMAAPNGVWAACRRCKDTGELIFYQESLLAPIMDELEDNEYAMFTVRRTANGKPYLAVLDGLNLLAVVMPMQVVDKKYLTALAEFEALCAEQLRRDMARAYLQRTDLEDRQGAAATSAEDTESGIEQFALEDGKNDG